MLRSAYIGVAVALFGSCAEAQCPAGGHAAHDKCWYLSDAGQTCSQACAAHGLTHSWMVAPAEDPMVPKLLGRNPATKQFSWARTECYVAQGDRYHTAKNVADSNAGDTADPGAWKVDVCRLACPCSGGAEAAAAAAAAAAKMDALSKEPYPGCAMANTVLRHAGAHAIFVDLSTYGAAGCWQNDCKNSDKFNADDKGICARACAEIDECTHWTFGEQEGATKCFFRKSDAGREGAEGFASAAKSCAPTLLPPAQLAKAASEIVRACDGGKSDACPDMVRGISTWKFAISSLKKATNGKVDAGTAQYIGQVGADTDAFAAQMSEENFPVITANNRQVFNALEGWISSQATIPVDPNDASLPNPLIGKMCGPNSCYERV